MRSNYDFDMMAIVICVILYIVMTVQYHATTTTRGFKKLAVLTVVAAALDIAVGRIDAVASLSPGFLMFINTVYLLFPGTLGYAYVCYVGTFLHEDRMPFRQKFAFCSLCVYYISLIINLANGFLFYVDEEGMYHDGRGRLLVYYFFLLFMMIVLIAVLDNGRIFTKKQSYLVITFTVFLLAGMAVRMFVMDDTPLTYICIAMGLLTSIFFLETPDYNKLIGAMKELEAAKEQAENSEKKVEEALLATKEAKKESDDAKNEAEKARLAAEKADRTKSEFLAGMSHEIRTPINAVLGFDEMILRESSEPVIKQYAMDIKGAGRTLLGIINDILDFSKVESGKMDIVPTEYRLFDLLSDVINMFSIRARGKGLYFEYKADPDIPDRLLGDDRRIKQILINILNNAVKYTDIGGSLLKVSYERAGEDEILLKISVSDTGRGMRKEDIDKLFKPYERIEEERSRGIEGTGLGMSITERLLEMMGSRLEVQSVFGEGSTFSFSVLQKVLGPEVLGNIEYRREEESGSRTYAGGNFTAPNARILAVDDTEINLKVFKALLKHTHIRIDTATSGGEGFKRSCETKYDILFLDHMMPDVDGVETLELIRNYEASLNIDTPAVMLTANALSGARETYFSKGFDDYISKPVDPDTLEKVIRKYLPAEMIITATDTDESNVHNSDAMEVSAEYDAEESEKSVTETGSDMFVARMMGIKGISVADGMSATGSRDLYEQVTGDYVGTAQDVRTSILTYLEQENWKDYTIRVHSLKSTSRLIGATELAGMAEELERAGNALNEDLIREKTPELIAAFDEIVDAIRPYYEDSSDKPLIPEDKFKEALVIIRDAATEFDLDTADAIMKQLAHYRTPDGTDDMFHELKKLMAEVERDGMIELINTYLQ